MKQINLKDIYPFLTSDCQLLVEDAVAEVFTQARRSEQACHRRIYRNRSHYSLDCNDGIENSAVLSVQSPDQIYEQKEQNQRLHAAISQLPEKQAKRVYAYFFLGLSMSDIASSEGVSVKAVSAAIRRALTTLKINLNQFSD